MSKIYEKTVVEHLQSCLDTGNVKIESFDSYENILPGMNIKLGDVAVHFYKKDPPHPKIPGFAAASYLGDNVDRLYTNAWNELPIKSHMLKDFRYLRTDADNQVPYKTFTYTDKDGKQKRALVRFLFEIEDMDADQPECLEYYFKYTDLVFNDACYMIIKIEDGNTDTYTSNIRLKVCDMTNEDNLELPEMPAKGSKKVASQKLF